MSNLAFQRPVLNQQPLTLTCPLDQRQKVGCDIRLGDVIESAQAHTFNRRVNILNRSDHDDLAIEALLLDELQHLKSANVGHQEIQQHDIKRHRLQYVDCNAAVLSGFDIVAVLVKPPG